MAHRLADAPNLNALWAGLLVEELMRQGVRLFVVCPGSRSTPLAVAVAHAVEDGRAEWVVHHDERAAAFVALGWGRATGMPAAVVTTSGTAVANLLPAAVEADAAGVPLLLLTADRPPELRETGANQTIRQPPLFQSVARWTFDVPPPTADVDPAFVLTTASHAVARSRSPAGPVHVNLAFREPLGLEPDGTDAAALLAPLSRWVATGRPYTRTHKVGLCAEFAPGGSWITRLAEVERGVVVFSGAHSGLEKGPVYALAERLGWPLLADVTSHARWGADPNPTAHYDLALAAPGFARAHRPDAVLLIGGRPTSKRLLALLEAARPDPFVVVQAQPARFDPDHLVSDRLVVPSLPGALWGLVDVMKRVRPEPSHPSPWAERWAAASAAAEAAAYVELTRDRDLNEPWIARTWAAREPRIGAFVLAASMPIRDVDSFAPARACPADVIANRGASGIDGTIATAYGAAIARARVDCRPGDPSSPTLVLIGDLALLHDQTSLMLLRDGPPVVVVVVNNDGGGIFHLLPAARGPHPLDADMFEKVMATPHGLTFEHAAAQVGLPYHAPTTADAFEAALDTALALGVSAVIEVKTDRHEQAALRERIREAVVQAVDATLA